MATGDVAIDKTPSPPKLEKLDWLDSTSSSQPSITLTEHISRYLMRKVSENDVAKSPVSRQDVQQQFLAELKRREDLWRAHEKAQIGYLQQQHSQMLTGLHTEIDQLQNRCTALVTELITYRSRESSVDPPAPESKRIQKLTGELKAAKEELTVMRELSALKEAKLFTLERKFLDLDHRYKTEMEQKNGQIKELSAELNDKASQIVQLTTQLHQIRLKEAVERQKAERLQQQCGKSAQMVPTPPSSRPTGFVRKSSLSSLPPVPSRYSASGSRVYSPSPMRFRQTANATPLSVSTVVSSDSSQHLPKLTPMSQSVPKLPSTSGNLSPEQPNNIEKPSKGRQPVNQPPVNQKRTTTTKDT